jgi:hypothetical protein
MNFSRDDIAMLAECERDMDSGKQPFVRDGKGDRWAMPADTLAECGCISGQTVSGTILRALLETNLAKCRAQLALRAAAGKGDASC